MKAFDITSLIRKSLREITAYSSARDEYSGGPGSILLDANENPFDNGTNRYPDPQQRLLKKELAALKGVLPQQILLGNGSDEILDLVIRCFCNPEEDNIIVLPPTYGMYGILANINGVEVREVPLGKDFQPDPEKILAAVDERTKIIFLCSPNNPTGNSFSEERIKAIVGNFNGLVVMDEAYIDFSQGDSWISSLRGYSNLFVLQTFSKAYGVAGIRLGIGYASEEIIRFLNKIKLPYNVNVLTQKAALERLGKKKNLLQEVQAILEQRSFLESRLRTMDFVDKIYPSDANFLLVKVDDANKRYGQFLEKGLVLRNRSRELNCENTLRISIGTAQENARLLEVAQEFNGCTT